MQTYLPNEVRKRSRADSGSRVFVIVGMDAVVHPKRHMNSWLRRGGEMARDINEIQVQLVGLLLSCGSGWLLYELIRSVWAESLG